RQQVEQVELPDSSRIFAIGYDGTTAGYYGLSKTDPSDRSLYWHDSESDEARIHHRSFVEWIEACPPELFREKIYAGYRTIKDPEAVARVIAERSAFEVRLVEWDPELVRPPGQEKASLARFHRLVVGVCRVRPSSLRKLTFIVCRNGSMYGDKNRDY